MLKLIVRRESRGREPEPMRVCHLLLLLLTASNVLWALDPKLSTRQYLHTTWAEEAAVSLPAVQTLAQTADGYLWVGTANGLFRSDGLRFVAWDRISAERLPGAMIRRLQASRDGSLWVSTDGGTVRLYKDLLHDLRTTSQLGGVALSMAEDSGAVWAAINGTKTGRLVKLDSRGGFHAFGPEDGLPPEQLLTVFIDDHHQQWLGTGQGLYRWKPGAPAERVASGPLEVQSLAEDSAGNLLAFDAVSKAVLRLTGGKLEPVLSKVGDASLSLQEMKLDRDGNIWIATIGEGLLRLKDGRVERIPRGERLSSEFVNAILEDREGSLWVGTARGLDRYRDPRVLRIATADGLSSDLTVAVTPARGGAMWVATAGGGVNRVEAGAITKYLLDSGLPGTTVAALYQDPAGGLWAGSTAGLAEWSGGRFKRRTLADGGKLNAVFDIAGDRTGNLWMADAAVGLVTLRGGRLEKAVVRDLPAGNIYQLQTTHSGALWIGYFEGGVARVENGSAQVFGEKDGLAPGHVQAIYEDAASAVWVGTSTGLSRFRDGAFTTWTAANGLPPGGVFGIVEDGRGNLWLLAPSLLVRVPLSQLTNSQSKISYLSAGLGDGLRVASGASMGNPHMALAPDGRLWVCTNDGVAIIDAERFRPNPVPPGVAIEGVTLDGKTVDIHHAPPKIRGNNLQIVYTGLSLTVPQLVRFRYKLEGADTDWTDAGTRRDVNYIKLPHGHYTFRLTACNNDGLWNEAGAALPFEVTPYFYETWLFQLFAAVAFVAALWGGHRYRVARVAERFRVQLAERTRITHELHDSVLQGFSGVLFQLEAASKQFESAPERSKHWLDRAIRAAEQSLTEARIAIRAMRLPELESHTLPEALEKAAKGIVEGTGVAFRLNVSGPVRHLSYDAQADLFLIGREAITNAVNHAHSSHVSAGLDYSRKELRLVVEDNGDGFDPEVPGKDDHYGMSGMRRRAERLGASLKIESAPGRGAKVEVTVPLKAEKSH